MKTIYTIIEVIYLAFQLYWLWAVGFMFVFACAAFVKNRFPRKAHNLSTRFLMLIPAYKEDGVIVETVRQTLMQFYPHQRYEIAVIADGLKTSTLAALAKLPIKIVEVHFEKSTKAKAINEALARLSENYDAVAILDADNHPSPNFLIRMNNWILAGHTAIQGRRIAKNKNSKMAILDAVSEEVNNRIYCKGHTALGLSSKLSGSGMVFEYQLFKNIMREVTAVGGFDKELELRYTQQGHRIAYDHHAKVLDEKVASGEVFARQRRRWLSAQYHYLRVYFRKGLAALFTRFNVDFFNRVIQLAIPPRLLMPVVLGLASLISLIISQDHIFWIVLLLINMLSFLIAIPRYLWGSELWKALGHVPFAIGYALKALIGIKGANKKFIHTPHGDACHTTHERKRELLKEEINSAS